MKHRAEHTACLQANRCVSKQVMSLALSYFLYLLLTGCSTWRAPAAIDDTALRERAVTVSDREVQVSATVLSIEDNLNYFGANINDTGIQSIWVEVVNKSPHTLWLLQSGTDPDYFSPLEVAWSLHTPFSPGTNTEIDEHFDELSFENLIPPGTTRSGILYVNPHHETRVLNIDLLGQQTIFPFTLFPPIPEDRDEKKDIETRKRLEASRQYDYQEETAFRTALEQLPCCAVDSRTSVATAPVNIIFVGKLDDIGSALARRGYRRDPRSSDQTHRVFGRPPVIVLRKTGQGGVPANWMRMWAAPFRYQGQPVILAQSGRPVGGRFLPADGGQLVLHPDVDNTRTLVIEDMLYSGGLAKIGYVADVEPVTDEQLRNHPDKYSYHTDGLRAVLFISDRYLSISDVQFLGWARPFEYDTDAKDPKSKSDVH